MSGVLVFGVILLVASAACRPAEGLQAVANTAVPPPTSSLEAAATQTPKPVAPVDTPAPTRLATTTETVESPTSTPPEPITLTHAVQAGETLTSIAALYNVTAAAIIAANNLSDPDALQFGQELLIPDALLLPTATPEPRPTAPSALNGVALEDLLVLPQAVQENVREVYAYGQSIGRFPARFSKLGDSTTLNPPLLAKYDTGEYALGPYAYLQTTIDHYAGSFSRYGVAARHGLHSWSVFDPFWADKEFCEANETVIACELRLNNPTILIVRLGSNDAGAPSGFEYNLREIVTYAMDNGVVPVLVTKADRFEGADNINNIIIRRVAADMAVPLLEFDLLAATLPERGLDEDGVHMVEMAGAHDYSAAETFASGHALQDLSMLLILDAIWQLVR